VWSCPAWIEDALWKAAPAVPRSALLAAIVDRSRRYTSERDRLVGAGGAPDLAARAVFFTVADAAKILIPLAELAGRQLVPAARPLRVLDLGAGMGAMTFGALAALAVPMSVLAVDRDRAALSLFERAAAGRRSVEVRTVVGDAAERPWGDDRFDLVVAGSVLNELAEPQQLAVARALMAATDDQGAAIVLEPALRDTSRALHRVRDALLERGEAHVFAPCVRQGTPCPALADHRDWCHEDRPTQLPPRAAALARATGLRDAGLKFSYLVLRHQPTPLVPPRPDRLLLRVVSQPSHCKGKHEFIGCGDDGRHVVRLLRRHRSPSNRPLERAVRGDVVVVAGRDVRLDDPVERLRPAGD
jgi:SAM-dependent methyltransferase